MTPARRPRARRLVPALVGAFALGSAVSLLAGPTSPRLSAADTGSFDLVADVRASLVDDRGYQSLSVARVRGGEVSYAGIAGRDGEPPTPQTPYELGSITKTFTGSLLADGVTRGELSLDDRLSVHLSELAGTPAGDATLRQLATHTAGLPAFPDAAMLQVLAGVLFNENTYGGSTEAMLEAVRTTEVTGVGDYRYSNLGMSLLGHAEARAAGVSDWPTLARVRILDPLGMTRTGFALTPADIPADAAKPYADNGWPAAHWWGPAFAPAGSSTWTTAEDLMTYAQAVLAGRVAGPGAVEPVVPIPGGQIGLAWHQLEVDGVPITWHNGGTGGYRTILGLDRTRGQAVLILSNSTRDADRAGIRLASIGPDAPVTAVDGLPLSLKATAWPLAGLALWLSFAWSMFRSRTRLAVASNVVTGIAGLVALLAHGPWAFAPAWLWGGLVGASVVLLTVGLRRAGSLPAYAERRRLWGWISFGVAVTFLGFVVATT